MNCSTAFCVDPAGGHSVDDVDPAPDDTIVAATRRSITGDDWIARLSYSNFVVFVEPVRLLGIVIYCSIVDDWPGLRVVPTIGILIRFL